MLDAHALMHTLGIRTATACTQLTPTHAIRTPLTANCMERLALECLRTYHIYYTPIDSNSSKHRVARHCDLDPHDPGIFGDCYLRAHLSLC